MNDAPDAAGRSREGEIRVHPLVAKLIETVEDGEGVVELRGFIGPASRGDDSVPLYTTLELTDRLLVPRDAIIHVEEPGAERRNEEPTSVYVRASAELRLISCTVTTLRADEATATVWASKRPRIPLRVTMGDGGRYGVPCRVTLRDCIQNAEGDISRITQCISSYIFCMEHAQPWNRR
jgi:hypothetical protein